MAGYRINERNTGSWSLQSEPKLRRIAKKDRTLNEADLILIKFVLEKVHQNMQHDIILSNGKGISNEDSTYTSQEDLTLTMPKKMWQMMGDIIFDKLENL